MCGLVRVALRRVLCFWWLLVSADGLAYSPPVQKCPGQSEVWQNYFGNYYPPNSCPVGAVSRSTSHHDLLHACETQQNGFVPGTGRPKAGEPGSCGTGCFYTHIEQYYAPNNNWISLGPQFRTQCGVKYYYVAAPPPPPAPPNLGAPPACGVGNPVSPASGNKFQRETDYLPAKSVSGIEFVRYYNGNDDVDDVLGPAWRHSFSRKVVPHSQPAHMLQMPSNSHLFPTAEEACEQGWLQIRSQFPGFESHVATYANGTCEISASGQATSTVPVFDTEPVPVPPTLTLDIVRDDGQTYRFENQGGALIAPDGVPLRALLIDDGFQVVDEKDNTETYESNGRLVSVVDRVGRELTMSYSGSQLSGITDEFGRSLALGYDANGRLATMTDPALGVTEYDYDAAGRLSTVTYSDGKLRTYLYEDLTYPNALTGLIDENGARFATWTYDAQGRTVTSEHAGGAEQVSIVYNADGTATVTDALDAERTYSYEVIGGRSRLATVTGSPCSSCQTASTTYDANGFPASRTDFNGNVTTYVHDSAGREESRTEAFGTPLVRTIATQWHATLRLPTQIDEPGRRTTYTYAANGNRLTETVLDIVTSESRTTTWTYTTLGMVDTVNGPRIDVSDITDFDYDDDGNLIRITNALGQVTEIPEHDAHGNPKKIVDPNGVETTLTYDLRQRLKTRTVAGATTTFDYDGVGQLDKVTLPGGAYLDYTYDAAHRLTDLQDNLGNRIHYTLDALGNRTKEEVFDTTNTLRRLQSQVFDALGRLEQIKNAANQVVTEYGYDAQGNRTSQLDFSTPTTSHTTSFTPDALNRIKQVTDAANGITQYGYNALDQLVSVTDPKNLTTSYTVTALGDLKTQVSPDTGTTNYSYDAGGNRKTQTDARGVTATYSYDALNRLTGIDYPGTSEDVTYFYDGTNYSGSIAYGLGRLTGIQDESGTTTLVYNARGTLASETKVTLGQTYLISHTYDAADRLATVTYPSGRVIGLTRNAVGQVTTVTSTLGTTVEVLADTIQYAPFGAATAWTLGNGIAESRSLNQDYRINAITAGPVQNLSYTFDLRGNITDLDNNLDATRNQGFGYDALSRLDTATGLYGSLGYTYDGVGNRTTETRGTTVDTYGYPATSHRLDAISGGANVTFGYDAAGNTTQKGADTLTYNSAGRLSQVVRNGLTVGAYTYNAQGQRVIKTASGAPTVSHHDAAGNLIAETASNGAVLAEYVYIEGQPLAYFASATSGTAGGGLLGLLPTSPSLTVHYFHVNHLATPQHVTDDSGAIVWSADYEPFGEASVALASTVTQNLRFPGQYFDAETGVHQNWMRDYDPEIGRYYQPDPLGLWGGDLSIYAYAKQNPLRFTDPTGEQAVPVPTPVVPPPPGTPGGPVQYTPGVTPIFPDIALYPLVEPMLTKFIDWCMTDSKEECYKRCYATYEAQIEVCNKFPTKNGRRQCFANANTLLGECQKNCK